MKPKKDKSASVEKPSFGFTPGPWEVNAIQGNRIVGDASATEFDKLQINNANATVATVYRSNDARLISQAPMMAVLLRDIVRLYYSGPSDELLAAIQRAEQVSKLVEGK